MSFQRNSSYITSRCLLVLVCLIGVLVVVIARSNQWLNKVSHNGFDLINASIAVTDIYAGGPPKDGISALLHPKFTVTDQITYLQDSDRVLGVERNGIAKAYPIRILVWHEIVNDDFNGTATVVTYCPLCGTGMTFDAQLKGRRLTFGVSGLLYNSDMLLYDHQTESLWSQLLMQAVSGQFKGAELALLPIRHTTWGDWKERFPETLVLSSNTGFSRDYGRTPYMGYEQSPALYFPVKHQDDQFHPKEMVLGVDYQGVTKAYPFSILSGLNQPVHDEIARQAMLVLYDGKNESAHITTAEGVEIPSVMAYWFAWFTFHPETDIYSK